MIQALVLAAALQAQPIPVHAFPLPVRAWDPAGEVLVVGPPGSGSPAPGAATPLEALAEADGRVRIEGVALPDGSMVDLVVEAIDLDGRPLGYVVDGAARPDLAEVTRTSAFVGGVVGRADSEVALAFSTHGSWGWIRTGGRLFHLISSPDASGDWTRYGARWVGEDRLAEAGWTLGEFCDVRTPPGAEPLEPEVSVHGGGAALSAALSAARIAVESDYQLYQVFGDLNAESVYVTALLSWIAHRFEEQLDLALEFPYVGFYTSATDPWTSPETAGATTLDMLYEFQAGWTSSFPAVAELGAFLSGSALGGGIAWLPGICNRPFNFSVSANLAGGVTFPVQANHPANWDFFVLAHELGHNFGAPHTHDFCPPIDECAPQSAWGSCQSQQACTSSGTVMSYCHLCAGGLANITTFFHPSTVGWVQFMLSGNDCMPVVCEPSVRYCAAKTTSAGCTPVIDSSGHPNLAGIDDFRVSASDVTNQQLGVLFWGPAPKSAPFQGGTLCVQGPHRRTTVQASGGNPPPDDCSGAFDYHWSQGYAQANAPAGTTVHAQYWFLDPASPSGTGLTDAIEFTFCP